jgi:uncharacterized protein (TIGR00725 family)
MGVTAGGGRLHVAVIGAGTATADETDVAVRVGRAVAEAGAVLVCGGLGGVMEAACRGARQAGGTTVGILPGSDRAEANPYVDVVVPTGMGEARNALVVGSADAVVAVGGGLGTLSEIALALRAGTAVVGLGTWDLARPGVPLDGLVAVSGPVEAVALALARGAERRHRRTAR